MKVEQVWAEEAGVQVRFTRNQRGHINIVRIMKAENGHEYEDSENKITISGWRWDRIVCKMAEEEANEE